MRLGAAIGKVFWVLMVASLCGIALGLTWLLAAMLEGWLT